MKHGLICLLPAVLAGCSSVQNSQYMRDKTTAYQRAQSVPSLTVPADLSDAKISSAYNIPPRSGKIGLDIQPPTK